MKMSITAGGIKSSITHPGGEDLNIYELVEQVVTPLLITAGFSQESIAAGFVGSPEPVREGIWIKILDAPEGFAFLGMFEIRGSGKFAYGDVLYFAGGEWVETREFGGVYPYAARIGSSAHAFATENLCTQS